MPPSAESAPSPWARAALEHLRALLRIDTTNPPGNERPAAEYVADTLRGSGIEPIVLESAPGRASVVARLPATSAPPRHAPDAGPLLLNAHLDVVPVEADSWTHPPFGGEIHDGWVWGRGAVDMKNMAAMSLAVLARLAAERPVRARDVIFAAVADEEAGCHAGSRFLVEQHPERVRAAYALGEVGGFSLYVGGRTLYPVMVAEKGLAWLRARVRGTPGHGSMPHDDNALVKLAEVVARLGRTRLPHHAPPVVHRYIRAVGATQTPPVRAVLEGLLHARTNGVVLDRLLPDPMLRRSFAAATHNTVSPTVLAGGSKVNVIPGEASVLLDGRTLPGQRTEDLLAELRALVGPEVDFEVLDSQPPVETSPDTALFRTIAAVVAERDPGAIVVPYLIPGFTDAKHWSRLGTRCYGFAPVRLPADSKVRFADLFHGHDERIPVDGFLWGADALYDVVARFCRT